MKKALKLTFIALLSLALIAIVAIPFIPADSFHEEIELQISQSLGLGVKIGKLSLMSLPGPGIKLSNIQISSHNKNLATATDIQLFPRLDTILSDAPEIRKIHVTGLSLHANDIKPLLEATSRPGTDGPSTSIAIDRIIATHGLIQLDEAHAIGPFRLEIRLSKKLQLETIDFSLENQSFQLHANAINEVIELHVKATDWTPPVKPTVTIDSMQIKGKLRPNELHLNSINVIAYEGMAKGNLVASWRQGWLLDSRIEFNTLNLGLLLNTMDNHSIDGTAAGNLTIRSSGPTSAELADNIKITGKANIVNGHIYEADLEQAARSLSAQWTTGGQTPFDEFSSQLVISNKGIRLTHLKMSSELLAAEGNLRVRELSNLDGKISVGLNEPSGLLTMPLQVSGTLDQPRVRPTDEALAGGAIGTAILGPGVGTAVGVKAGEIIGNIGNLFGTDDGDKDDDKEKD